MKSLHRQDHATISAAESHESTESTDAKQQVYLMEPKDFDSASEIADRIAGSGTIVLNFEGTDKEAILRLLDFLSGVAYTCKSQITRIAEGAFLITPPEVDLKGDLLKKPLEDDIVISQQGFDHPMRPRDSDSGSAG